MPGRCDICGVEALEGQEFAEECLPFRRSKRYCQSCHVRLTNRILLGWLGVAAVFSVIGLLFAWSKGRSVLASSQLWFALLLLFQWVMLVPHELGHALAARLLGYGQIRILIGSGKPVFTAKLFGIHWLFNIVPFGGLTLAGRLPATRLRWKEVLFIGTGPAVSVVAAGIAWLFIGRGALFDGHKSALEAFFWANLIVLGENLFPRTISTSFGQLQNDGLLLWNTIFHWGKPPTAGPQPIPRWQVLFCQVLKWVVVAITGSATLLMGSLASLPFWYSGSSAPALVKPFVTGICLMGMFATGWITFRFAKQPVARFRKAEPVPPAVQAISQLRSSSKWLTDPREAEEINAAAKAGDFGRAIASLDKALQRFPNDVFLLASKGDYCFLQRDFASAESTYTDAIKSLADTDSAARLRLLSVKLACALKQGHVNRVENACLDFLAGTASVGDKIQFVDQIVCAELYEETPQFLTHIERWTRKVLELAPGILTLKGTLGGILAEQGKFAEAEPLLNECRTRSTALHDQAFASFYLGKAAMSRGDFSSAKELLKHAIILHTEPRLQKKAELELRKCDRQRVSP